MNDNTHAKSLRRKRGIQRRLRPRQWKDQPRPMFAAKNIHYEVADRGRGITCGGIGAMHLLAQRCGLPEAINRDLHLFKRHLPYFESDHVLNIAYNILAGGNCIEDLELLRNDEAYMDALGALRIPDPTTAGDFCRRFDPDDVEQLMRTINQARLLVWKQQPPEFFDQENLIAQLKGQVGAMKNPLGDLVSNWAYMVMASLAWTMKAWAGLMLPVSPGRWKARHERQKQTVVKIEFKQFLNRFLRRFR